jgi:hypothetical protein
VSPGVPATPALQYYGLRAMAQESLALAPSTTARYSSSVLYYVRWLLACGLPLSPCWHNPTEGLLQGYVAFLSDTCSAQTIKGHLAGP